MFEIKEVGRFWNMKTKAKIAILEYVLKFCTNKNVGHLFMPPNTEDSFTQAANNEDIPIGSLILLTSANSGKFYLSWLIEQKENGEYLLESVEDNTLCWWSNVCIWYLNNETTSKHSEWRWLDAQFLFYQKWINTCDKATYAMRALKPIFLEGNKVILQTRKRYDMGENVLSKTFDNWRKVTSKEMIEFCNHAVQQQEI